TTLPLLTLACSLPPPLLLLRLLATLRPPLHTPQATWLQLPQVTPAQVSSPLECQYLCRFLGMNRVWANTGPGYSERGGEERRKRGEEEWDPSEGMLLHSFTDRGGEKSTLVDMRMVWTRRALFISNEPATDVTGKGRGELLQVNMRITYVGMRQALNCH
ncbi:hypothetical protein ANANG_G00286740, partial [Anguilla anguilla]